jgi:hypothetical protein
MTTFATITSRQIRHLRNEAATAGDSKQVEICDRALNGSDRAKRECVKVIRAAEAMAD